MGRALSHKIRDSGGHAPSIPDRRRRANGSAEAARNVSFGVFVFGIGEDLGRVAELFQFAAQKEAGLLGDAGGLLHVVRDNHDGVLLAQVFHQLLDAERAVGVQRGARLVHEDHFRLDGQYAGDAQPLLLAAGEGVGRLFQFVLDLVPEGRAAQSVRSTISSSFLRLRWP